MRRAEACACGQRLHFDEHRARSFHQRGDRTSSGPLGARREKHRGWITHRNESAFGHLEDTEFVDSIHYSAAEMIAFAEHNLAEAGVIASFGTSLSTVQSFLDAARQGASFLILPTPDDLTAQRAMEAIHRVPFVLAQRYHQLAIEEMK